MLAMTEVILKEKLNKCDIDNYYRYGVYFYTTGIILLKNNKQSVAKEYLMKADTLWKDILNPTDPGLDSIKCLIIQYQKKSNILNK
jgi:hypothetical protein